MTTTLDTTAPWWRTEVPAGIVISGRVVFFAALLVAAMGRGQVWVSEPAGIWIESLAAGAVVATAWLHDSHRRVSNAIQLVALAPWFVAALARGVSSGATRSAWSIGGGVALLACVLFHLRGERMWTRWLCILFAFFWCAIP